MIEIVGRSHTGQVRENNEDRIGFDTDLAIAVLADGMGGLNAGEVASKVAVETIVKSLKTCERIDEDAVELAIDQANAEVLEQSASRGETGGMGTTVVVWTLTPQGQCFIGHVGDSRAYRLRNHTLKALTSDHSVVQQMLDEGVLSEGEARVAPNRNIITRAVGLESSVEVDVRSWVHGEGDLFLLCSDGLTDMLSDDEIYKLLLPHIDESGAGDLEAVADALVSAANSAGGHDNVSVLLIRAVQ
ncbi:MAG: Stp1/IreP family PP2C-type Ser/Thr phosphatase [Pseudomonadales bacterium]